MFSYSVAGKIYTKKLAPEKKIKKKRKNTIKLKCSCFSGYVGEEVSHFLSFKPTNA